MTFYLKGCPRCSGDLTSNPWDDTLECIQCSYKISKERLECMNSDSPTKASLKKSSGTSARGMSRFL